MSNTSIWLRPSVELAGNVLTLHYRGARRSPGNFSIVHVLQDADAAVAFVRRPNIVDKFGSDTQHIVLSAAAVEEKHPAHGGDDPCDDGNLWRGASDHTAAGAVESRAAWVGAQGLDGNAREAPKARVFLRDWFSEKFD